MLGIGIRAKPLINNATITQKKSAGDPPGEGGGA
jgi:hypothetical protein